MNLITTVGLALVAIGFLWKATAAQRSTRLLRASLKTPEPAARASAARGATSLGLDRCAELLTDLVAREHEPMVLHAVAEAVMLRQWEPADRKSVLQLRTWAADWLMDNGYAVRRFGPAVTRLADMGGPQREFDNTDGVTTDRILNATLAEVRALCARLGAQRAGFLVGDQLMEFDLLPDQELVSDVADRVTNSSGARGALGGYDIRIEKL